ncbi:MAG: M23 family metallopeptidase [Oscillospiraceae bacterium]|nr:M23 family metallopeptidase [Oscillospiraceae bacterium]
MKKFVSKIAHSGFYIILFLCMCAIGISGYVMYLAQDTADTVKDTTELSDSVTFPFPLNDETLYDFDTEEELPLPEPEPEVAPVPEEPITPAEPPAKKAAAPSSVPEPEPSVPAVSVPAKEEKAVFTMAVSGAITEPFSGEELVMNETLGDWRIHSGVDIAGAVGTDVRVIADGKVTDVNTDSMMGNTITVEHADGLISIYANLADGITLKPGDTLKSGDVIAKIGQTALAECMEDAHLHLEVAKNGKAIDPLSLYPAGEE